MSRDYWLKQTAYKPLFPELEWSRPENKQFAGKLLIVGGNLHGFAAPAEAYNEAVKAGVGVARVLLPDALQKTIGPVLEAGEFAPSTPSGSFSQKALAELLSLGQWADGVLLAGDFGHNSETAILLEKFIEKYNGQLTLTKDAVDYFTKSPSAVLQRAHTTLVLSLAQLQQLARQARFTEPITFDLHLLRLVDALHTFTAQFPVNIIIKHLENILVGVGGRVSTTKLTQKLEIWQVRVAAHAVVWWLQNPLRAFEALSSGINLG